MKKIYFITGNKSKFREAKLILKEANIKLVRKNLKLREKRTLEQEEVAREQSRQAFSKIKKPIITDDTAVYFETYKNFPGTYTKFLFKAIGFKGIKKLLKNCAKGAYFKTLICYKDRKNEKVFSGIWKGKIVSQISKKFNSDWEYNSIFIPSGYKKPLSEISLQERAESSHRRKALNKLTKYLKNERN